MAKRVFDILVASFFLLILSPVYALLALLIRVDSRGPVHFTTRRVGRNGRLFRLYKFRTMVPDAPGRGPGVTRAGDPRITRLGNFLRKMKLDEIPQLINVLKGDMSVIGPRPEDPRYLCYYTTEQSAVFNVRPGMAGLAFLKYRHEEELLAGAKGDVEEYYSRVILPDKLSIDLEYVKNPSVWRDFSIFAEAFLLLFRVRPQARQQTKAV